MGAVYLAQDRNAFNRRCVVKEMLPYYATAAEKQKAEKDFEREARVLASLHFDGAPQVYEYFIENGKYYLVMEFVEGENLEERATRLGGRLPQDEALRFGLQLTNTLVYLAKQTPPVIHRDIKPANIILDEDQGKVKLVDFGLAKESIASGMTGTLSAPLGTPGYAPMEQYTNLVETRTDVYALGATLHHLLTGRDPRLENSFDFPSLQTYLPGVKPELESLIARMVAIKVADRPTAAEARDEIEALILPQPVYGSAGAPKSFTFRSGAVVYDASELALVCDQNWDDGIYHLYAGHLEAWLDNINRHDLAVRAESIRVRGGNQAAGLEEFLRAANPTIPLPSLAVSARSLDLGVIEKGTVTTHSVQVKNVGRGCLFGRIAPRVGWATIKPQDFSLMPNQTADLAVTINTATFAEGAFDEPAFEVTSNGGLEVIGCQATVSWQPALSVEPKRRLNLGEVLADQTQPLTAPLVIRNTGGGVLQGHVTADALWLSFDAVDFTIASGGSVTIQVTAQPSAPVIQITNALIRIETAGSTQELTASVGVRRDWFDQRTRVKSWLGYASLLALGGASLVSSVVLALMLPVAANVGYAMIEWYWGALGAVACGAIGAAALFFSQRWAPRLDEIENYYHGQDLRPELLVSHFRLHKPLILAGIGLVYGLLIGLRCADSVDGNDLHWLVWTPILGALSGALVGIVGLPSPALPAAAPWKVKLWRGATIDESTTIAAVRTGVLLVAGAWFGFAIAASGNGLQAAWWGSLVGLLLASERAHFLALRVRWLLDNVRVGLLAGLGVFFAVDTLLLVLRGFASYHPIQGYGYINLSFPGFAGVLWPAFVLVVGYAGALGGLWVADHTNLPRARAWHLFFGAVALLILASFPIYLFTGLLINLFVPLAWANWIVFLLTATTIGLAIGALLTQRRRVESASQRARQLFSLGVYQSRSLTRTAQGRIQQQLQTGSTVHAPGWLAAIGHRIGGWFSKIKLPAALTAHFGRLWLPSLAELETSAPLPLVFAAAVTALLLQVLATQLVVDIAVGLGIVFFFGLLVIAALIGIRFAVLYARQRHP